MKLCNIDETMYMYGWNLLLLVTCVGYIYVFMTIGNMCWICYIGHINIFVFDFLWKWIDIRKNKIKWGNIVTLPSAGRWQRALPSAGRWQRALPSAGRWQSCHQLADGKEPATFAICRQTTKSMHPLPSAGDGKGCRLFAVCQQTAQYAVSLLTGLTPLRGFAICQLMAKAQALCHQPADGKEAFAHRNSDKLFAICWLMAKPLPSADHAFAICHGRWQSARFQ